MNNYRNIFSQKNKKKKLARKTLKKNYKKSNYKKSNYKKSNYKKSNYKKSNYKKSNYKKSNYKTNRNSKKNIKKRYQIGCSKNNMSGGGTLPFQPYLDAINNLYVGAGNAVNMFQGTALQANPAPTL
jgi:hypothetical protein